MNIKPDATQPGVPDNTNDGDVTPELDKPREPTERELAMDRIAEARQESFGAEHGTEVDQQLAVQLEPASTPKPDALDSLMVKVKIDGVESEVSVAEMQRQFQKNGAAERRLEEATRLLNEARTAQATQPHINDAPVQTTNNESADEGAEQFIEALFDGDKSKAMDAMQRIGLGRQQPTPDVNELAKQLTPVLKQQMIVESAFDEFKSKYADIVDDPYLADLADRYLDADVKAGVPFTQALEAAGKKTRDWLASKGVMAQNVSQTTSRESKLERKARIDSIPALGSKAVTNDDPVQSATDVINEMRKARGLTV